MGLYGTADCKKKKRLTTQDGQDSAGASELAFGFFGGRADLDALESEHGHYHGSEVKQQCNDHQGTARLHMTCRVRGRRKSMLPVRQEVT